LLTIVIFSHYERMICLQIKFLRLAGSKRAHSVTVGRNFNDFLLACGRQKKEKYLKSDKMLQALVTYSSTYVLVALSIDRYDAITHPMNFSGSWRRARGLVAAAWILSGNFEDIL
jgi:hypothetical protein